MALIRLGPFEIDAVIGSGGMADVWRGRHHAQGHPVAVKVLTTLGARDPQFVTWFRSEARAVAAMDHPGIIGVLDYGTIDDDAERRSDGRLVAGSPYLVMEWASRGTLADVDLPSSWPSLRDILLPLLDALAHAHARGVVHRDLKLRNVLCCDGHDGKVIPKLADFGIARPVDPDPESETSVFLGTAAYAAPEQIRRHAHEQGPWTDLYALGCLAFMLASGRTPFSPTTDGDVLKAHLSKRPPKLEPRIAVPAGFDQWIARMLEKDSFERFRHAADASWALRMLGDATAAGASPIAPNAGLEDSGGSSDKATTIIADSPDFETVVTKPIPAAERGVGHSPFEAPLDLPPPSIRNDRPNVVPPIPEHWDPGGRGSQSPLWLSGVGLGLYGLRAVPMVGRETERDRLWAALRRVHESKSIEAIVLHGPEGYGKGRLAEWLCERATEVGAATVMKASHDRTGGGSTGLGPMLARNFHCSGATRDTTLRRVQATLRSLRVLDPDESLALVELISPAPSSDAARGERVVRLGSRRERYEVLRRHIERVAAQRPVILWIDDAHYGSDALTFVQALLDDRGHRRAGVLVLCTVCDEILAERPIEREILEDLGHREGTDRIEIGPLAPDEWATLVRNLFGLDGELAMRVQKRAAGNPQYAVQLIGDWIQRGLLEPSERGFQLREGATMSLPDDLHAIWAERISQLLDGRSDWDAVALEIAAVLGADVDAKEWTSVCDGLGVAVPWSTLEVMLDRRLARSGQEGPRAGWSFAHAMVRDAFEAHAASHGRLEQHHRACAETLREGHSRGRNERIGRHLLAAGAAEEAAAPLLEGARELFLNGDVRLASAVIADRESALRQCGVHESDPRWGEGWELLARAEVMQGNLDEGERWAAKAESSARRHGWPQVLALALVDLARVDMNRGRFGDGCKRCQEAFDVARAADDVAGMALAIHWEAILSGERGDPQRALELFERSHQLSGRVGNQRGAIDAVYETISIHRRIGNTEQALAALHWARERYAKLGIRNSVANTMCMAGEIARDAGRFEDAERSYRDAIVVYDAIGSGNAMIARVNLALAMIGRLQYAAARTLLESTLVLLEKSTWFALAKSARVELLPCLAADRDWPRWDTSIEVARSLTSDPDSLHPDPAWALEQAAVIAFSAGERSRAIEALRIAREHWIGLRLTPQADAVSAKLAELGDTSLASEARGE